MKAMRIPLLALAIPLAFASSAFAAAEHPQDRWNLADLEGKPGARERYLRLISSGASDYPYELVNSAGVDLATREPYDAVSKRMNRITRSRPSLSRRAKSQVNFRFAPVV